MLVTVPLAACTADDLDSSPSSAVEAEPVPTARQQPDEVTIGVDPRPRAYWVVWSTCGPDNRAAEAAANGGADEGFYLVDDLLADPGMTTGSYVVDACEPAIALLDDREPVATDAANDLVRQLAGELLAAELSLAVGATSCAAVLNATAAAQILLNSLGFLGPGQRLATAPPEDALASAERIRSVLLAYNSGALCQ